MEKIKVSGELVQLDNKDKVAIHLNLTRAERDLFLFEIGTQPKGMIAVVIHEVPKKETVSEEREMFHTRNDEPVTFVKGVYDLDGICVNCGQQHPCRCEQVEGWSQ